MKKLGIFVLFVGLVIGSWFLAYGATSPEITTTDSTTSTITIALDSTGMALQDSLILILCSTLDDTSDGTGTEYNTDSWMDTTSYTFTGLVPGTLYYIAARAESAGNYAYTATSGSSGGGSDTVRVEYPQEVPLRGSFFPLYDATSWNGLTGSTTDPTYVALLTMDSTAVTIQSGNPDSTMWFQNAPYLGLHWEFSHGDSVNTTFYYYGGRVPGGETAPQVSLIDSLTVITPIGDTYIETDIGVGQLYVVAKSYIGNKRDSDLSLWLRSHYFEERR